VKFVEKTPIKETILFTLILGALTLLGFVIPVIGNIGLMLTPLPLIVLAVRRSSNLSIIVSVISALSLAFLVHPVFLLFVVFFSGLVGISMGAAFEEKFSPKLILLIGSLAAFSSFVINLGVSTYILDFEVLTELSGALEEAIGTYQELGLSAEVTNQLITEVVDLIETTYLTLFLSVGMVIGGLNYYFAAKLINREQGYDYPPLFFLVKFKLPRLVGLLFVISLFFSGGLGQNVNILVTFLLVVEGGAVVYHYFKEKRLNKLVLAAGILFFPLAVQILLFLGFADVWFDFRQLKTTTD
jgi:uncharacterized protein YybS (DUF2232 family)